LGPWDDKKDADRPFFVIQVAVNRLFDPIEHRLSAAGEFLRRSALNFCLKGIDVLVDAAIRLGDASPSVRFPAQPDRYTPEPDRYARSSGMRD